jgi:hypothetical protein
MQDSTLLSCGMSMRLPQSFRPQPGGGWLTELPNVVQQGSLCCSRMHVAGWHRGAPLR